MDGRTSTFGLVERFKCGDTEAFGLLFRKYQRRLAVLVHYKLGAQLSASLEVDDVLQEVFLAASRDIEKFNYLSPGSFMAWLSRIADHVIVDQARFYQRKKRHAQEMVRFRSESNPGGPDPLDSNTPSRIFSRQEDVKKLLERMDALPEDYRRVILLAKFEGLTTQEIAEKLERPKEGVAVLLHRAVKRLQQLEERTMGR